MTAPTVAAPELVWVTDAAAAKHVLRSPEVFSPANALDAVTPLTASALRVLQRGRFALPPVLANVHGPQHRQRRAALAALFTSDRVALARPWAQAAVADQVRVAQQQLAATGMTDLTATVAGPPPTQVMLQLLGWPCADVAALKRHSDDALELFWGWPSPDRQVELATSCVTLFDWLRDVVCGQPNVFAEALAPCNLSTPEVLSVAFFVAIAGHQTTTYLGSAALRWALTRPGGWHVPDGDVAGWASRWAQATLAHRSSVPTWRRRATCDTELAGQHVPAGSHVVVRLSGHRKPVGDIPDAVDYQLAFGVGLHRCLGAALAEMEVCEMLTQTRATWDALTVLPDDQQANPVELLSFVAPGSVRVVAGPAVH